MTGRTPADGVSNGRRSAAARLDLVPDSTVAQRVMLGLGAVTALVFLKFGIAFGWHRAVAPVPAWKEWVDIGSEANLPTWWNATLLAVVAALAIVAAVASPRPVQVRRGWAVVAAAAVYLSIDEATAVHERLTRVGERTSLDIPTYAWLVPGLGLAVVGSAILVVAGRALPSPTGRRLGAALAAYGSAAIGLEALTGWIRSESADSVWFTFGIVAEEGIEMLACVYAIGVILDGLDLYVAPRVQPWSDVRSR